jgi:hypothetical protein
MNKQRPQLLYIVGVPGSGKTTLMQALTADATRHLQQTVPFGLIWHEWGIRDSANTNGVWELGASRAGFGGTDALGMSVQPKVVEWLAQQRPGRVIAEGDRLGNGKFFTSVTDLGYDLRIVVLEINEDVVARRRVSRAAALGVKEQNPTWLKGRTSKVAKLAEAWLDRIRFMDATQTPQSLAFQLRHDEPIFAGLGS